MKKATINGFPVPPWSGALLKVVELADDASVVETVLVMRWCIVVAT